MGDGDPVFSRETLESDVEILAGMEADGSKTGCWNFMEDPRFIINLIFPSVRVRGADNAAFNFLPGFR